MRYLRVAAAAGNSKEADEQCKALGDHPRPGYYGEALCKQAARLSAAPATQAGSQ